MEIDWARLRAAAIEAMRHAYAPYSNFPVGAAALVDDGRVVVGCNVENAAYGVVLCAECGVVSSLHATGGGRLVALSCVDATGEPLMPCGRCRQLLWEHGGPECLVEAEPRPLRMAELLPHAFDVADLEAVVAPPVLPTVPERLAAWRGRGTVFVHPDVSGGKQVWTGYWERSAGRRRRRAHRRAGGGAELGRPGRRGGLGTGPHAPGGGGRRGRDAVLGRRGRAADGDPHPLARIGLARIRRRRRASRPLGTQPVCPEPGAPGSITLRKAGGVLMSAFTAVDVIRTKRDGGVLSDAQIDWVVDAYTRGQVADEQMSALAMAILLRGMTPAEIARWTAAMIASGERLDLSGGTPAHRGQALHRRRRRQDHAAVDPAGRRLRRGRTAALRPRTRPHRRHPGQAGVDSRLAGRAGQRRVHRPAARRRRGDLRGRRPTWPRPTASCTRCATSPARSRRSR